MPSIGPFGYSGGWITSTGPADCPKDSYVDAQNVEIDGNRLVKMNGNVKYNTNTFPGVSPNYINGMSIFQTFLVATDAAGTIAECLAAGSTSWTDITNSQTLGTGYNTWMCSLNDLLVIGNYATTDPLKWSGTGGCATLGGSPPAKAYTACVANNYLFMGGMLANPYRVQWSNVKDPETWTSSNYIDVRKDDGTAHLVLAVFPYGEDLLIFKDNLIARFYTNQLSGSLGPLVIVQDQFGIYGNNSVDRLPDGRIVFMANNKHIYLYDGNTFTDISDQPYPQSNIQSVLDAMTPDSIGGFVKVYRGKNQIWVGSSSSWTNALGTTFSYGVVFIYDYIHDVWLCPYVDIDSRSALNFTHGDVEYMVTGANGGWIYKHNSGNDNGNINKSPNSFDAFVTKSIDFGPESRAFQPRSIYFPFECGSFSGALYYGSGGYNNPTTSSIAINLTGTDSQRKKVLTLKTGNTGWNTAQFRLDGAFSNQKYYLSPFYLSDEIETQS